MLKNKTIVITGGAGFIGSHLAERLHDDNYVRIVDDFSTGSLEKVSFLEDEAIVHGDICDEETAEHCIEDADIVFHMAAMMGVQRTLDNPLGVLDTNIDGTRTVLRAAAEAGVDHVVVASTSEVYGDLSTVPYQEQEQTVPETNYAVAKLVNERYVQAFAERTDLNCTAVRYFNVYGPRQSTDYVIPIFVDQAVSGGEITIHGDGEQTRDFTYISDAVDCTVKVASNGENGEIYNVGTGVETSIAELATTVADIAGTSAVTYVDHPRPYVIRRRCADISKATEQLGYTPSVELKDGIRRLVDTMRE